jgi:hypothetical protein
MSLIVEEIECGSYGVNAARLNHRCSIMRQERRSRDMAITGSLHVRVRNISQAGRLGDNLSMSQAQNRDVTVHLHMHVTIRMKIDDR